VQDLNLNYHAQLLNAGKCKLYSHLLLQILILKKSGYIFSVKVLQQYEAIGSRKKNDMIKLVFN